MLEDYYPCLLYTSKVVTNRWLALPIFAVVMFIVYYLSISTVGTLATDWVNDGVFGDGWHLFGIGSGEYSEQVELFEAEAEAAQAAGTELTMEEPDPANYGCLLYTSRCV